MTQIKTKIPAELEPAAVGGMVTDSKYVKDRVKNKTQEEVNADTEERVSTLEESVGTGGSVDERIETAKREVIGDAGTDYNTLGKLEDKLQEEVANRASQNYTKSETYSKTELNNMITTPNQEYETYTATDQTTAVTDVLPATGSADTVYRVGSWNGTQYEEGVYSEYSWNGSTYIHLSTKTEVGEVYDISAAHATGGELATYADLAAALGTNGANIPQSLRKGGMSVKFIQVSDNKYVQYRLLSDSWSAMPYNWHNDHVEVSENNSFGGINLQAGDNPNYTLALQENMLNYVGYENKLHLYTTSSSIYPIPSGKVIDKFEGTVTEVIFIDESNNEITVNVSDLPYVTTTKLVAIKIASGTSYNFRYHVQGSLLERNFANSNERYNAPLFNLLSTNQVLGTKSGFYIKDDTGVITSGAAMYRVAMMYIHSGKYIVCNGSPRSNFYKYTDNTFTILSSKILESVNVERNGIYEVELTDGYYAIEYSNDVKVGTYIIQSKSEYNGIIHSLLEAQRLSKLPLGIDNYLNTSDIVYGKYLNSNGAIASGAADYFIINFYLPTNGYYFVNLTGSGQYMMSKFTNNNRTTVDSIILKDNINGFAKQLYLEAGYYTYSGNKTYDKVLRTQVCKISECSQPMVDAFAKVVKPFNGQQIDGLSLVGTATWNNDGTINVSGGIANKAQGAFVMSWYYSQSARFNCSNGVSMIIGKYGGFLNGGGYFEAYTSNGVSYVSQYNIVHPDQTVTLIETKQLDFILAENEDYEFIINKYPDKINIEIIGAYNEFASLDFSTYAVMGKAFVASNHTAVIKNFNLGLNCYYDIRNIKLGIWGHSFVAAVGSLGDDYVYSFPALLASAIGEKEVVNLGFGGDVIGQLRNRMRDEVNFVATKMQYGMICIGENDYSATSSTIINGMQQLVDTLINANVIPILFTISPLKTGSYHGAGFADVNSWIRSSGCLYVDMDKVFWDENGNVRDNLYGDNIHPNVAGHRAIYNRIKMDCPFLF